MEKNEKCIEFPSERINPKFWDTYPLDEKHFDETCLEKGIHYRSTDSYPLPPTPPIGYSWDLDNGGIRYTNMPIYRLWNFKFGYMPMSE